MVAKFRCGFGLNTTTVGFEWTTSTSGSPAIDTSIYRSNGKALRITPTAAENIAHIFRTAQGDDYIRVYFYVVASPTADGRAFILINNAAATKVEVRMRSAAQGRKLQLFNQEDATQIGSDSSDISLDTWYRLELRIDSTTLSSTAVEARLYTDADPGTLIWNPSGTQNFTADPNRLTLGCVASDATLDIVFDDWGINDSTGSFENTWCGPGKCTYLRPDGDSSVAWSRGGTDSGANWSQLDESPPNDITDYVQSNTSGQIDDYTLDATPAAIASSDVINCVLVGVRHSISNTSGADPDFSLRIKSGSDVDEVAVTPLTTGWVSHTNADPRVYHQFPNDSNYQVPGTASAYTKTTLDSLIVGINETVTDTHFSRVSAIWVIVDHEPSGTQYPQSVGGTLTSSGAVVAQGQKSLGGTLTSSGTVSKLVTKTVSGTLTSAGSLINQAQKMLSGVLTSAGEIAASKVNLISLGGTLTTAGTLVAQAQKTLGGAISPDGALVRETIKIVSGTLTSAGTLTNQAQKVLSGTLTSAGNLAAQAQKALSGTLATSGELVKQTSTALGGTLTSSGEVVRQAQKFLSGAISPDGTLARQASKMLSGTLTSSGEVVKSTLKFLSGALSSAGDLITQYIPGGGTMYFQSVAGTLTSAGELIKTTSKMLSGSIAPSGTLSRLISKFLAGVLSTAGALATLFSGAPPAPPPEDTSETGLPYDSWTTGFQVKSAHKHRGSGVYQSWSNDSEIDEVEQS